MKVCSVNTSAPGFPPPSCALQRPSPNTLPSPSVASALRSPEPALQGGLGFPKKPRSLSPQLLVWRLAPDEVHVPGGPGPASLGPSSEPGASQEMLNTQLNGTWVSDKSHHSCLGPSSPNAHVSVSLLHWARERAGTPGSSRPGLSSPAATGEPSDLGPVSSSLRAQTPMQKSGSSSAHGVGGGGQCEADGVQHVPRTAHSKPHPHPLQRQQTVICIHFRASE